MAIHDFKSQRLFIDGDLSAETSIEATREQANYLLNVLRLKTDDKILIFNGRDGEWQTRLEATGRKKCSLHILEQTREQPKPFNLTYCFAPLKQARQDYMVQKAVEMGAGRLQPVITQFTQIRSVNENRVRANAIEAAEQCGIISIPQISEPITLSKLIGELGPDTHLIFCDEAAFGINSIEQIMAEKLKDLALLIGPEGGFSDEERAQLSQCSNVTKLGLGPRILRADTAAIAAMAIVQAHVGDWYK